MMRTVTLTSFQAHCIFSLLMCADPSPLDEARDVGAKAAADDIARAFGFKDWIEAYHAITGKEADADPPLFEIEHDGDVPAKLHAIEDGKTSPSIIPIGLINTLAPKEVRGEVVGARINTRNGGKFEVACNADQYRYLYDCYSEIRKAKEAQP